MGGHLDPLSTHRLILDPRLGPVQEEMKWSSIMIKSIYEFREKDHPNLVAIAKGAFGHVALSMTTPAVLPGTTRLDSGRLIWIYFGGSFGVVTVAQQSRASNDVLKVVGRQDWYQWTPHVCSRCRYFK